MRRKKQIREADRIPRHPWMTIQQPGDLGDADPRVRDGADDLVFIAGRLTRGATTRLRVIGIETCRMTYQSVMPISWFIRAAARGSSGCSRGPGTTAST